MEERRLVYDRSRGYVVDEETGVVVDRIVDTGRDWSYVEPEDWLKARASPLAPGVHDLGLHTVVGGGRSRLARINERLRRGRERKLVSMLSEVRRICAVENLPRDVAEFASDLLMRLARRCRSLRNRREMILACIYVAARFFGSSICMKELVSRYGADRRKLWGFVKEIELGLGIRCGAPNIVGWVDRIGTQLGLEERVVSLARKIAVAGVAKGIALGCDPRAFAAACIYVASHVLGKPATMRDLSSLGPSQPSIRSNVRKILDGLLIEVLL